VLAVSSVSFITDADIYNLYQIPSTHSVTLEAIHHYPCKHGPSLGLYTPLHSQYGFHGTRSQCRRMFAAVLKHLCRVFTHGPVIEIQHTARCSA